MFQYQEIDALAVKYSSDKNSTQHGYTKYYDFYFSHIKNKVKNILEIGVLDGASIKMWKEYFPNAIVHGLDINPECLKFQDERTKIYIGNQVDEKFISSVTKDKNFDIIIDDGSHLSEHQIKTFNLMFPAIVENGIYIIEDTKTSYHSKWTNGESCVNYFKRRIDDVNMYGKKIGRRIKGNLCSNRDTILKHSNEYIFVDYEKEIEAIHFYSGIIFIFKQGQ